jgi:predicted KAP-like P-loop ATPase
MTNEAIQPTQPDALNRGPYLEGLMKFIFRLDKGVIAIDGEWGVGKTWFGKNLKEKLDNQGSFKTIWLDVFEADWSDEPAVSLIAEIAAQLEVEKSESFLKRVAPLLGAILPLAAKAAIRAAANYAGLDEEMGKDWADDGKTEASKFIQKHLEEAKEKYQNLSQLKKLLNETVNENAGKLVIFVDELDRCSPGYAVRFLERLKHLFDLEGVINVLLWNREQVSKTVEVFYGAGSNGQMYLDKFIDYPLHIPVSQVRHNRLPLEDLIDAITPIVDGKERSISEQLMLAEIAQLMAIIASIVGLTAREAKRLASWWVMSSNRPTPPILDTWLLAIKVKHPNIFTGIRKGDVDAHKEALELLQKGLLMLANPQNTLQGVIELHKCYVANNFEIFPPDLLSILVGGHINPTVSILPASLRRLEFDFDLAITFN